MIPLRPIFRAGFVSCRTAPLAIAVRYANPTLRRHESSLTGKPSDEATNKSAKETVSSPNYYSFEQMRDFSSAPSPSRLLIDVRNPSELQKTKGTIPTAFNVPLGLSPDFAFMPSDEFEERFGFEKPIDTGKEAIFFCKAGVRARAAAELARQAGWQGIGVYKGSMDDWIAKGGKVEREESS